MIDVLNLIETLCPDGAPFKHISEVCDVFTGGEPPQDCEKGMPANDSKKYPVYSNGLKENALYGYSSTYVIDKDGVTFSSIGTIGHPEIRKAKFTPIIRLKVIIPKNPNVLRLKFLKYALEIVKFKQQVSSLPNINSKMISQILIPVPPIKVQDAIIDILDTFIDALENEKSELEKRNIQLNEYRKRILESVKNAKQIKMGEAIEFLNGRAYKQDELLSEGKYKVLRVGNFFTNNSWYYSNLELDDSKYCNNGDLLYCWSASLGPQIWSGERVIFHYHIWRLLFDESKINKRYLYHFLANDVADINGSLTHSTMPHVSMSSMKERVLILPSLEKQKEIATILDTFENICSNLESEIETRQKQYEYYRDKLLTFKELKA